MRTTQLMMMVALLSAAPASLARAQQPTTKSAGYSQAGAPVLGRRHLLQTANAEETLTFTNVAGSTVSACFPIGTLIRIKLLGPDDAADDSEIECACAVTMAPLTDGVSFTSFVDTESACRITDTNGPDADGACVMFTRKEGDDLVIPGRGDMIARPGGRPDGMCSLSNEGPFNTVVVPGCRSGGSCPAGSCDTSLDSSDLARLNQYGCAYVSCQCDTANTYVSWSMIR